MNPLVMQIIAALITASPDLLNAIAALIKAAHGQPLTPDEHTEIGRAIASIAHKGS